MLCNINFLFLTSSIILYIHHSGPNAQKIVKRLSHDFKKNDKNYSQITV